MGQKSSENQVCSTVFREFYFSVNKLRFFFLNSTLSHAAVVLVVDFRNA